MSHAAEPVVDQIGHGSHEPHPTTADRGRSRALRHPFRRGHHRGPLGRRRDRPDLLLAVLIAGCLVVPATMAFVARGILREAAALDRERTEMHQLYGQARRAALVDGLTGLGNHRAFQDELAFQLEEAKWQGAPLALLIFDVDGLKAVNDGKGHVAGDRLLAAVGQIAAAIMRRGDRAYRVGGDEFAVDPPEFDVEIGLEVGRRMLTAALRGGDPSAPIEPFSLSVGVSAFPDPSSDTRSCTGTLTRPSTGASVTVGPPWSPSTPATMARPRSNGRKRNSPPMSRRSSPSAPCARSTSRSSRWRRGCPSASRASSRPTDGSAVRRRGLPLRRGRGGKPDGRARPALPGDRRRRCRRPA